MRVLCFAAVFLSAPAAGQTLSGDRRFQTIEYNVNRVPTVRTAPETEQVLLLAPTEVIQTVALSDPGAFIIEVSGTGDSLTVRPNGRASGARLSIRTALRAYEIDLATITGSSVPQIIQFSYSPPAAPQIRKLAMTAPGISYKHSGSKVLQPQSISDDGKKMYLTWSEDQAVPAIFAVGPSGSEEMVNGFMRAGVFTIDRVYDRLVFRIDRLSASARRIIMTRNAK